MANQGGGRFYHVLEAQQIAPYVAGELGEISALAARDTVLRLVLPGGTGLEPFAAAHTVSSQSEVSLGDIPTDTELEVVVRLLLPAQPALAGSRLYLQFLQLDPAASHGIAFSEGARLDLGY